MSQSATTLEPPLDEIRDTPGGWPPSPSPEGPGFVRSEPQSLARAVRERKEEYIRKKTIKIKVGSWNVAAIHGTEKDLGGWFVDGKGVKGLSQDLAGLSVAASATDDSQEDNIESVADQERRKTKKATTLPKNDVSAVPGGDEIGLYVLGLQEVVDISSASSALKPYVDPDPGKKWKRAMEDALPDGYTKVAEQQLLGLLILIYAAPEVALSISYVSASSVGTGLMGYLGNKGAVSVRLVLGEATKLVFVNCHLSAGSDTASLGRRNWDASQILSRTTFSPTADSYDGSEEASEKIGDEDFAFWFGDLNYRLEDIPGEDVRRLLLLHTRNEYDIENLSSRKIDSELGYVEASGGESSSDNSQAQIMFSQAALENVTADSSVDLLSDPTSLQTTLQSLLPHDQLRIQQKKCVAFHNGWQEGDINFLPTYKYDIGSVGMFDSGEKRRSPSWCDRILYRSRRSILAAQKTAQEAAEAKKKDAEMKARGVDEAASDEGVLFDYNPDVDGLAYGDDYDEDEDVARDADITQSSDEPDDSIVVSHYVSHQRVLSSDHKPLDAVFAVQYNAAIPGLKAKVQQEVARSLDQAENESRPTVTVVVDHPVEDKTLAANDSTESNTGSIDFGNVKYRVANVRGLTIANTGQMPATFAFLDRPGLDGQPGGIGPSWLKVEVEIPAEDGSTKPDSGKEYKLSPGETTSVRMTIDISDDDMVHKLNEGHLCLDEILVLRIVDGRDHFLPIHGTWVPSCFCRTLEELIFMPTGGVRSFKRHHALHPNSNGTTAEKSSSNRSAPKELSMLTDAIPGLVERSIAEWDMVHEHELPPWKWSDAGSSWPFDAHTWTLPSNPDRLGHLAAAREALDNDISFDQVLSTNIPSLIRLEILTETLLFFLSNLRDGIITSAMWSEIETQITNPAKSKEMNQRHEKQSCIMDILTSKPVHAVSFTHITTMLSKILHELAAVPSDSSTTTIAAKSPRPSTSSLRSAESDISAIEVTSTSTPSSDNGRSTRTFFPAFRRRDRSKTAPSGGDLDEQITVHLDRRKAIERAYVDIFTPVMICSEGEKQLKAKDKKVLGQRKRRVLEAFLSSASFT